MLLKTVASILLELDKNKGCLSMIFHLLFKNRFFFGYYRTSWYTIQEVGTLLYRVGHESDA